MKIPENQWKHVLRVLTKSGEMLSVTYGSLREEQRPGFLIYTWKYNDYTYRLDGDQVIGWLTDE